jgi:predicted ATPase with chaperone activity
MVSEKKIKLKVKTLTCLIIIYLFSYLFFQVETLHSLSNKEIEKFCQISTQDQEFLKDIIEKFRLSARAYHRVIKIARTIADLDNEELIKSYHLKEAVGYRRNL